MGGERETLQEVMVYGCRSLEKQRPVPHREGTVMTVNGWMMSAVTSVRAQVYGHDDYHHHHEDHFTMDFTLLYFILFYFSLLLIYRIHEYTAPSHTVIVLKSNFNSLSLDTISATSREA